MKTCPICNAQCFDDMDICYGCMHRFSEEKEVVKQFDIPQEHPIVATRLDEVEQTASTSLELNGNALEIKIVVQALG